MVISTEPSRTEILAGRSMVTHGGMSGSFAGEIAKDVVEQVMVQEIVNDLNNLNYPNN